MYGYCRSEMPYLSMFDVYDPYAYCLPNTLRMMKSRIKRRAECVARMRERRVRAELWGVNRKGRNDCKDLGIHGWVILK
jgi:hypothetical protein